MTLIRGLFFSRFPIDGMMPCAPSERRSGRCAKQMDRGNQGRIAPTKWIGQPGADCPVHSTKQGYARVSPVNYKL